MSAIPAWAQGPVTTLLVGLFYYAGAYLGVTQTVTDEGISILWPPNAIVLAALLLVPLRLWVWVVPAVLVAEYIADVPAFPPWAAVGFGLTNLFEVFLAASLIRWVAGSQFTFDRLSHAGYFLLFGPLLASMAAAVFGASIYVLLGREDTSFLALWRIWWFGDALGLLLLTPLLVVLWQRRRDLLQGWSVSKRFELLGLWLSLVLVAWLVFRYGSPYEPGLNLSPVVLLPFVLWAAVRFGVAGATSTVAVMAVFTVAHMVHGSEPFVNTPAQYAVWVLQEYLAVAAVMGVGLAALLQEIETHRLRLRLFSRAISATNDAVLIADARAPDTPIIWVNDQFETLFGYPPEQVIGRNCRFLNQGAENQPALKTVAQALQEKCATRVELRNFDRNGHPLWIRLSIAPVHNKQGAVTHFVGVQHDLTELKESEQALRKAKEDLAEQNRLLEQRVEERTEALRQANQRLERMASTDQLTGMANRWHFLELAEREMQRRIRTGQTVGLMMLDLDHFKQINDVYGHLAGDAVLREVSNLLRNQVRPLDLCGRFGGEEFLAFLPDSDRMHTQRVAERIRAGIEALSITFEGKPIQVTTSIGVAVWDGHSDIETLIAIADEALYRAKTAGRNRVEVGGSRGKEV